MTIEELRKKLEKIPKIGVINKARRLAIQKQIYDLMNAE